MQRYAMIAIPGVGDSLPCIVGAERVKYNYDKHANHIAN